MMKRVYFDTETTGFNPGQICQLSIIVENEDNSIYGKNYFFEVDTMDPDAEKVHGLSIEKLKVLSNGERFKDRKDEILQIMSDATLVAHNLPFDEKFMSSEFWRCGISFSPSDRFDTMKYFKDILKIPNRYRKYGAYKNPKLCEVVDYLGLDNDKILSYTNKLFNTSENCGFHDSRFDTASMFVAVIVEREKMTGGHSWLDLFSKH